ncbi:KUP/HAK/KT family potassium transporter, partial [Flavobacterium chungangensis]
PQILVALNPLYAIEFGFRHTMQAFVVFGSVFLALTGAEALYADMGHFGARPIRYAWFYIAMPCLLLNYFGQGAMLLREPTTTPVAERPREVRELKGEVVFDDVRFRYGGEKGEALAGIRLTIPAGQTRWTFTQASTGYPYKVSVRARNKAGQGAAGTTTASTFGLPTAPTSLTATSLAGPTDVSVVG